MSSTKFNKPIDDELITTTGTISTSYGTATYVKTGNVVSINFAGGAVQSIQGTTILGYLPDALVPKQNTSANGLCGAASNAVMSISVNTNKALSIYLPVANSYVTACITYIAA